MQVGGLLGDWFPGGLLSRIRRGAGGLFQPQAISAKKKPQLKQTKRRPEQTAKPSPKTSQRCTQAGSPSRLWGTCLFAGRRIGVVRGIHDPAYPAKPLSLAHPLQLLSSRRNPGSRRGWCRKKAPGTSSKLINTTSRRRGRAVCTSMTCLAEVSQNILQQLQPAWRVPLLDVLQRFETSPPATEVRQLVWEEPERELEAVLPGIGSGARFGLASDHGNGQPKGKSLAPTPEPEKHWPPQVEPWPSGVQLKQATPAQEGDPFVQLREIEAAQLATALQGESPPGDGGGVGMPGTGAGQRGAPLPSPASDRQGFGRHAESG